MGNQALKQVHLVHHPVKPMNHTTLLPLLSSGSFSRSSIISSLDHLLGTALSATPLIVTIPLWSNIKGLQPQLVIYFIHTHYLQSIVLIQLQLKITTGQSKILHNDCFPDTLWRLMHNLTKYPEADLTTYRQDVCVSRRPVNRLEKQLWNRYLKKKCVHATNNIDKNILGIKVYFPGVNVLESLKCLVKGGLVASVF